VTSIFTELRDTRELIANLTLREVRGKYKRTLLGQGWSLVNPLAQLAIFALVFGVVIRINPGKGDPSGHDTFALWLVCGLLPWTYLANSITTGMGALLANGNLIKKVYFPRNTLVLSTVLAGNISFAIELAVVTAIMAFIGPSVLIFLPGVIALMVVLTAFALGVALLLSVANVYFRDTQHFVAIGLNIWFYATPIVYPYELVQKQADEGSLLPTLYRLNPMERFVNAFRNLLYDNRWPTLADSLYCVVSAAIVLTLGFWVFRRYEGRLAEEL
jgi:ABC-type polysaccharide/polyol phosphate export permease